MTRDLTYFLSIHGIVLQSIKSNMGHVWMDCPHREKLGWMEVQSQYTPHGLAAS